MVQLCCSYGAGMVQLEFNARYKKMSAWSRTCAGPKNKGEEEK
jgi:hypothetical protein